MHFPAARAVRPRLLQLARQLAGDAGTTVVELAVVLPLLMWFMIGVVDAGRLLQAYVTVNHAAREAARFAVTGAQLSTGTGYLSRQDSIAKRATDSLIGLALAPAGNTDPFTWGAYSVRVNPGDGGDPATFVEVEVYYTVRLLTPGLQSAMPYVRVAGYQRMLNEHFGVVPSLDRANLPATPLPLPTYTPIGTPTFTPTPTVTATPTITSAPTTTRTAGPSPTSTATAAATLTPTVGASPTASGTATRTASATATSSPTPTSMPVATATQTATPSSTATNTPTSTPVPTNTPAPTATRTATSTPTPPPTPPPTATPGPTATPTPWWCFFFQC